MLECSKPEMFANVNVRTWLPSMENNFHSQKGKVSDEMKVKIFLSFMVNDSLQWWELAKRNITGINSYDTFKQELLNYFKTGKYRK